MHMLEIKTGIQVLKPVSDVFDALVDPNKMKNYFIAESTGPLQAGETVTWKFAEMDLAFPITVKQVEADTYISFLWDGAMDKENTLVEINLRENGPGKTLVSVTEKSKPDTDAGIAWLKRNTEGWANFLACLKAWLEYGIHLRKGAFEPAQMPG